MYVCMCVCNVVYLMQKFAIGSAVGMPRRGTSISLGDILWYVHTCMYVCTHACMNDRMFMHANMYMIECLNVCAVTVN